MVGLSLVCHGKGAVPAEATAFQSDFVSSWARTGADADVIALSVQGLLCPRRVSHLGNGGALCCDVVSTKDKECDERQEGC